jgi:hypothetical protein
MRSLLFLPLLTTSLAFAAPVFAANDAADRAAIDHVVRTLNESPQSPGLFAAGVDGAAELARVTRTTFSNSKFDSSLPGETRPGGLVISHEPMGEATWSPFPMTLPAVVSAPPRFVAQSLRFVAPDVALLDTLQEYYDLGSPAQRFPVLLVLKKEKKTWRIASLRAMAQP